MAREKPRMLPQGIDILENGLAISVPVKPGAKKFEQIGASWITVGIQRMGEPGWRESAGDLLLCMLQQAIGIGASRQICFDGII